MGQALGGFNGGRRFCLCVQGFDRVSLDLATSVVRLNAARSTLAPNGLRYFGRGQNCGIDDKKPPGSQPGGCWQCAVTPDAYFTSVILKSLTSISIKVPRYLKRSSFFSQRSMKNKPWSLT